MARNVRIVPEISVLMSVYNGARWIEEAIESVLQQGFRDFEFVIIDDGSTDESLRCIRQYEERDQRIIVVKKARTGLADSLNIGIRMARGRWIARLDADDVCERERLERQMLVARADPSIVLLGTRSTHIDEFGRLGKTYKYPTDHQFLVRNLVTGRKFFAHSSALFRKDAALTVGGYRPRIRRAQDRDLWLRVLEFGRIGALPVSLIRYRIHAGQVSNDESGRRQIVDSRIAMTSYYLRQMRYPDPVEQSDSEFEEFRSWMVLGLEKEGVFEYWEFVSDAKRKFMEDPRSIDGMLFAGQRPRQSLRFIAHKMLGDSVSRKLAHQWTLYARKQ